MWFDPLKRFKYSTFKPGKAQHFFLVSPFSNLVEISESEIVTRIDKRHNTAQRGRRAVFELLYLKATFTGLRNID